MTRPARISAAAGVASALHSVARMGELRGAMILMGRAGLAGLLAGLLVAWGWAAWRLGRDALRVRRDQEG